MQVSELRAIEDSFLVLEEAFSDEPWKLEHDRATRCHMLEERIRLTLPSLMRFDAFLSMISFFRLAGTQDELVAFRQMLSNSAQRIFRIYELMTAWIDEVKGSGYELEGLVAYEVRLIQLVETSISLSKYLEVAHFGLPPGEAYQTASARWSTSLGGSSGTRSHAPPSDSPGDKSPGDGGSNPIRAAEGDIAGDPARSGQNAGNTPRPHSGRLPDPPLETGEGPAPFDLPFLGERRRVKARPGRLPLPDPIDFEGI